MNGKEMAQQILGAMRSAITSTLRPIAERLAALERRPVPKDGPPGKDGASAYEVARTSGFTGSEPEWVQSLRGAPGADGAGGERGERGEQGLPGVDGLHGKEGPTGKDGPPGQDGGVGDRGEPGPQGERGLPGADGKDGAPGEQGPPGKDGQPGERGERGEQGPSGDRGASGEPGEPGARGEPGERGMPGQDGQRGADGAPGPRGETGEKGADGKAGEDGRDGRDGTDALQIEVIELDVARTYPRATFATWRGGVIRSFRTTNPMAGIPDGESPEKRGWHVILNGIAGAKWEPDEDGRTFSLRTICTNGYSEVFQLKVPTVIDRGVYKAGVEYQRGDGCTFAGCFWIAQKDTNAKPGQGDGSGWRLAVKCGRDGKDGADGPPGKPGKDGKDLTRVVGVVTPDGRLV